jgi:DNA polymerase-3 subunit alpha
MIRAGALDSIDPNRARHMAELTDALRAAEQHGVMTETGQDDLFGFLEPVAADAEAAQSTRAEPWSEQERLSQEKATLGLYLTGHPISQYEDELTRFITDRLGPLTEKYDRGVNPETAWGRRQEAKVVVAGLIVELRAKQSKNGKRMAFATLDDRTGRLEVAAFAETFDQYREFLAKDTLLVAEGNLTWDDFAGQLRLGADRLMSIEQARVAFATRLTLRWPASATNGRASGMVASLRQAMTPFRGGQCPVFIEYRAGKAESLIQLGEDWRLRPEQSLLSQLENNLGKGAIRLHYA